jgi:hypothetical protein
MGDTRYTGAVSGNTLQGEFKTGRRSGAWSAVRGSD